MYFLSYKMKLGTLLAVVMVCAFYIATGHGKKYLVEVENTETGNDYDDDSDEDDVQCGPYTNPCPVTQCPVQ